MFDSLSFPLTITDDIFLNMTHCFLLNLHIMHYYYNHSKESDDDHVPSDNRQ